jgi:hypothetical protein
MNRLPADAAETSRRWRSQEWNVMLVVAIIVALGVGWLGWQVQIVRHRRAMHEQLRASGASFDQQDPFADDCEVVQGPLPSAPGQSIAKLRWLLGDEAIDEICLSGEITAADRTAIAAFPEAEIVMWVPQSRGAP